MIFSLFFCFKSKADDRSGFVVFTYTHVRAVRSPSTTEWLTYTKQQPKKKKKTFYTRALQNEEKFAFICMNILVHNIEKLYVNKYQSGSSPETEQLRQSELGDLQYNLTSILKLLFVNWTVFLISTFESIRVAQYPCSWQKKKKNAQLCTSISPKL